VPIIYWFTGLNAVQAPLDEILRYFLPYYIAVMITLGWTTGGLIQPLLTDVAHVLTMFEALRATVVGLFKPRGHAFKVTAKGGRRDQVVIAWPMVRRFALLAGLTLIGMLYASLADFAPSHVRFNAKVMNLGWSVHNIIVLLMAISVVSSCRAIDAKSASPLPSPPESALAIASSWRRWPMSRCRAREFRHPGRGPWVLW
jgi:cellulose synthase (UDP-forming)